jgi:hypothetical protein
MYIGMELVGGDAPIGQPEPHTHRQSVGSPEADQVLAGADVDPFADDRR